MGLICLLNKLNCDRYSAVSVLWVSIIWGSILPDLMCCRQGHFYAGHTVQFKCVSLCTLFFRCYCSTFNHFSNHSLNGKTNLKRFFLCLKGLRALMSLSCWILPESRKVTDNRCRDNYNTHFMWNAFSLWKSSLLWDHYEKWKRETGLRWLNII